MFAWPFRSYLYCFEYILVTRIGLKTLTSVSLIYLLNSKLTSSTYNLFFNADLETPKMKDLVEDVIVDNPYRLGLCLVGDERRMNIIQKDHRNDAFGALQAMFQLWLESCPRPRWMDVIKALRDIGENNLACKLEEKYVTRTLSSHEAP